ncbi:MAG: hypothetical protein HKN45_09720 [Flavobacteriales bacterium]|nr:hypothetical protein [Flavobacteriales bacterium]
MSYTRTIQDRLSLMTLLSVLMIFISASCNSSRSVGKEQTEKSFVISYGGGFAGKYDTYRIHNNGAVEIQNSDLVTYAHHKLLNPDSTKAIFLSLDDLDLEDYSFDRPGNMTYKLELDDTRVRWSDSDKSVRVDIRMFFDRVWKLVNEEIK